MKKKLLYPDTRLDWRDPDMPVLRLINTRKIIEVSPRDVQSYYWQKINSPFYAAPQWKDDPTYFLNKRRK